MRSINCWLKKKHYEHSQKEKAVSFFRLKNRPLREAAWVLAVSTSTLSGWNQGFDESMNPLLVADKKNSDGLKCDGNPVSFSTGIDAHH